MSKPNWPALLLAPSVVLVDLGITYALVTPSCERQTMAYLHGVSAVSLAVTLACTLLAWSNWRAARRSAPAAGDAAGRRPLFLAQVGLMVGALSSLVVLAMWVPQWIVPRCAV